MAIPQYAMPHAGSFSATAEKVSLAFSYQNECSIATALVNCCCTDGAQETGDITCCRGLAAALLEASPRLAFEVEEVNVILGDQHLAEVEVAMVADLLSS